MCRGDRESNRDPQFAEHLVALSETEEGGDSSNEGTIREAFSTMPPVVTEPPDANDVKPSDQQDDGSQHQSGTHAPPLQQQRPGGRPAQATDEHLRQGESSHQVGYLTSQPSKPINVKKDIKVVNEEDDLQKAIAMSIQDLHKKQASVKVGGDISSEANIDACMIVSAEDREVSRALEESLREMPTSAIKKKSNPVERKRVDGTHVGLVNIGNSCWFNVVCQPLFHLPGFRDMILNYKETKSPMQHSAAGAVSTVKEQKTSQQTPKVVIALGKLFALMLASEQKYIEPSECVYLFQGSNESDRRRNEQEDVCEFIHKLLERLEVEFNEVLREEGEEKESSGLSKDVQFTNPIIKLFYGQFGNSSLSSSEDCISKPETLFGQYPLHVSKYGDIHDSILASMSCRLLERQHSEGSSGGSKAIAEEKSLQSCGSTKFNVSVADDRSDSIGGGEITQEQWFKLLPPVLIFSLSRYEYSQAKQITEKVHNKFEFPELLYMDRYMENNKKIVQEKHVQVGAIKRQLTKLNNTLEQYQKYGTGEKKYPLKDILTYTLQFAETGSQNSAIRIEVTQDNEHKHAFSNVETEMKEIDVICESPKTADGVIVSTAATTATHTTTCSMSLCDPGSAESMSRMEVDSTDEMDANDGETSEVCRRSHSQQSSYPSSLPCSCSPKAELTEEELFVLRNCLTRWEKQVSRTEAELCSHINHLEMQLKEMYSEESLQQMAYRLHAVVVHEGQASAGHYWVYIRTKEGWNKYNDVQVCKSSWEDLQHDSLGGLNNASAYCLMYTDTQRHNLLFPSPDKESSESLHDLLQSLPLHLQEYVKQDNLTFHEEISAYENRSTTSTSTSAQSTQPQVTTSQQQTPQSSTCFDGPPPTAPNSPSVAVTAVPSGQASTSDFYTSNDLSTNTLITRVLMNHVKRLIHEYDSKPENSLKMPGKELVVKLLQSGIEKVIQFYKELPTFSLNCIFDFGVYIQECKSVHAEKLLHLHALLVLKQITTVVSPTHQIIEDIHANCNKFLLDFDTPTIKKTYKQWQNMFELLLETVWHLLSGHKAFEANNFKKALPLIIRSHYILKDYKSRASQLGLSNIPTPSEDLILEWRAKCLLKLNTALIESFIRSEDSQSAEMVVLSVSDLLVPALGELSTSNSRDTEAGATVRNQWCGELLEKELPVHCTALIEQVLEAVLNADCCASSPSSRDEEGTGACLPTSIERLPNVSDLLNEYKNLLTISGINTTTL